MEGKPLETGGFSLAAARKAGDGIDCSELYVLHNESVIHITGHTPIAPGAAAQEMGSTPGAWYAAKQGIYAGDKPTHDLQKSLAPRKSEGDATECMGEIEMIEDILLILHIAFLCEQS